MASPSERDVTRPGLAPDVEIVSPVELQPPRPHRTAHRARPARRRAPSVRHATVAAQPAPALVAVPALAVSRTPSAEAEPVNDRELPAGKTVTLIPVSSGPSITPDYPDYIDEFPTTRSGGGVRGGGRCPPRNRPGIGIATRPRPSLY